MTIWKYKHDRGGDAGPLSVTISVDGQHGVIGLNGIAPASGFEDGIINATGDLKAVDGGDYVTGAARPGIDPAPDFYRLTVCKNGKPTSSASFQPVLSALADTELDINALVAAGKARAATPQQLADLATGLTDLGVARNQIRVLLPQMAQQLADTTQALGGLNQLRDLLDGVGVAIEQGRSGYLIPPPYSADLTAPDVLRVVPPGAYRDQRPRALRRRLECRSGDRRT